MKYVINAAYGGFHLPEEYMMLSNCLASTSYDDYNEIRTDPNLISIIENPGYNGKLIVVIIPDSATDYELMEYDGFERVLYVKGGKIYYAYEEGEEEG